MGFRDDNEALRARIRALEDKNRELTDTLDRDKSPKAPPTRVVEPERSTALAGLIHAREAEEHADKVRAADDAVQSRERAITKLAQRPRRVHVSADGSVVRFDPKLMRDQLMDQLGWGYLFAFVNPGVFIMLGLAFYFTLALDIGVGTAIGLTVATWSVVLALLNLAWAWFVRPNWSLRFTDEHFALFSRRSKDPTLLGHLKELDAHIPEPDDAHLGSVRLRDGRSRIDIEKLSPTDLRTLRRALSETRGKRKIRVKDEGEHKHSLRSALSRARAKREIRVEDEDADEDELELFDGFLDD